MLNFKIKKIPAWVVKLKILPNDISVALSPYIFLSDSLYENYKTNNLTYKTEAILAHESEHIKREQAIGLCKFLFLYIFSKKFCYEEEIRAIRKEMKIYKSHGEQFDTKQRAKVLATFRLYHHCVQYEQAKKELDMIWLQT